MKVTFVVNSFNRLSLFKDAMQSLRRLVDSPMLSANIVVFDAGSTDGSMEFLRENQVHMGQSRLEIVSPKPGDDTSFSAGLNRGCAEAIDQFDPEYLIFFETDNYATSIQPFLNAISLLQENPRLGAVGFTVTKRDGGPCGFGERTPSALGFALGTRLADLFRLRVPHLKWRHSDVAGVDWSHCDIVYTSPLVVRVSAWRSVDGMDATTFPFSACDLDLALRMKASGYEMSVIRADAVYHDNLGQLSAWSERRAYSFHQGTFRLLRRHRGMLVWLIVPVLAVRHLLEAALFAVPLQGMALRKARSRLKLCLASFSGYP